MSIQTIPLSEGIFTIGHDKVFVPFDVRIHELQHRPTGSLLVDIQPFLVQVNGKNIVLDTGLGFKNEDGEMQLHVNLRKQNIEPSEVDMVLLSHLHKDHAGGIYQTNQLGIKELSFPNAMYYIGKKEFAEGIEKGFPSYHTEDFEMLKNSNQVEWLEDEGNIMNFISYKMDGGHCPYHISFLIHSEKKFAFYGGDNVPQHRQLITRFIAKYDNDGRKAMELRQEYAKKGKEENWTFLFYHDVKIPFAAL